MDENVKDAEGGSVPMRNRSLRMDDETWDNARAKAVAEGSNLSEIARLLFRGYISGAVPSPRSVVVYGD